MKDALLPLKCPKTSSSGTRSSSGVQYSVKYLKLEINYDGENGGMPDITLQLDLHGQPAVRPEAGQAGDRPMITSSIIISHFQDRT